MRILYEAILSQFENQKAMFTDQGLEPPVYIDLYDSQPDLPDQFEFICPAVFLDYSIAWEKKGVLRIGTLSLVVHVLTDAMEDTDSISKTPDGLKKIDYYETVVNLLEGIATKETSGLVLFDERPISTDYFNYHQLTFTCTISRRVNNTRMFADGTIESIPITGNIKERKTFDID